MDLRGFDSEKISEAVEVYGAAPGGVACLRGEDIAAQESIENGLYITWNPKSIDLIREEATRVSSHSLCLCGHKLLEHQQVIKKNSFIRPPKCKSGCRCFGYSYMPSRPEECGQWWLPRRRDFDLKAWRKRVQSNPDEYACIGCDLKITDHETIFETRERRRQRNAPVDAEYLPLSNNAYLRDTVMSGETSSAKMKHELLSDQDFLDDPLLRVNRKT